MFHRLQALALAALAFTVGQAAAQTAPPAYRSAMEGYRPFADEKRAAWKEANDNVGRIGGWRVYAKEAQGAASGASAARPAASTAKPTASAAEDPHGGHKH